MRLLYIEDLKSEEVDQILSLPEITWSEETLDTLENLSGISALKILYPGYTTKIQITPLSPSFGSGPYVMPKINYFEAETNKQVKSWALDAYILSTMLYILSDGDTDKIKVLSRVIQELATRITDRRKEFEGG